MVVFIKYIRTENKQNPDKGTAKQSISRISLTHESGMLQQ